jgi:hypothetical protein
MLRWLEHEGMGLIRLDCSPETAIRVPEKITKDVRGASSRTLGFGGD